MYSESRNPERCGGPAGGNPGISSGENESQGDPGNVASSEAEIFLERDESDDYGGHQYMRHLSYH